MKTILNFFTFYNKETMDYASDDIEYNRIHQVFDLFFIDNVIIFPSKHLQHFKVQFLV